MVHMYTRLSNRYDVIMTESGNAFHVEKREKARVGGALTIVGGASYPKKHKTSYRSAVSEFEMLVQDYDKQGRGLEVRDAVSGS